MAQPTWITPAGDLGTVAEGLFFTTPVLAVDPDGGIVKYTLIAGSLPEGIQVKTNGYIEGVPQAFAKVQGVPTEVSENVTSRFAVRAYVETPGGTRRIADRTFSITVTGQDLPEFVTPAGSIGLFYDGTTVEYQIEFTDDDPGDVVIVTLEDGELPPGLTINTQGLISGFITPIAPLPDTAIAGYDRNGTAWDQFPFDFSTRSISKNYQFTIQISDGKDRSQRVFEMYVVSKDSLTADTTDFTADDDEITADVLPQRTPFITNYPTDGDIGTYRHSNFFAYQVIALDLDGDPVRFELALGDSSDLPPGLTFNQDTGWLYGYLPDQGATELTYQFSIYVYKKDNPDLISPAYAYSITTVGDIETGVTWLSAPDLGVINNGAISLFQIKAITPSNRVLFYRLKPGPYPETPGVYNKLPQGLQLLPSGNIAGRVSFDTFALDGGTTTFDQTRATRLNIDATTFDSKYVFTVEVYSQDGLISVFREFNIIVNREFNEPYESLYIQAMPGQDDRDLIDSLLQNQDIIQPSFLFRPDDPYFGVSRRVIYTHAYGLKTATLEKYVEALQLNHYRKQLILGDIRVAQARDNNTGDVVYEVVYSNIVDTGVNELGESPGQSVETAFPITVDGETVTEVYPNSLIEMRDQVVDTVGQYAQVLPLWMTSKQSNGRVLGFTRAFVIAYTVPGKGDQLAYNIRTQWGERLNLIDFTADRYILDRLMTKNWIPYDDSTESGSWLPAESVSFDATDHYSVSVTTPGSGYDVGDQILVSGSDLGGNDITNDAVITIQNVKDIDIIDISGSLGSLVVGDYVETLASLTPWNPVDSYNEGDIVVVDGPTYYEAQQAVAGDPDPLNWIDITDTDYWAVYDFAPSLGVITSKSSGTMTVERIGNDIPFSNVVRKIFTDTTTAGSFIIGQTYVIKSLGTTDFTAIGASTNELNVKFIATGAGSGTGIAISYSTTICDDVTTTDGIIVSATITGTAYFESKGQSYTDLTGTAISGTGTGAEFTVSVPNTTVFDDNSMQFISPVDEYSYTDQYNKYLLFPKVNILYGPPEPPPPPPISVV